MAQLLIGADPELFLSVGNKFVSAYGLFPGTKQEPYEVEKGAVQVDGMALEFNIHPAKTAEEFSDNIEIVLRQMRDMVRDVDKDMKLNFVPVAKFDKNEFDQYPEDCKMLGCDPDFNTSGKVNPSPEDLINIPLRTASGHVHIGFTEGQDPFSPTHFADCVAITNHFVKNDQNLTNPIRQLTVGEKLRLKYYGYDGSFRPKHYGIELRSYSNRWVEEPSARISMFNHVTSTMELLKA